MNTYFNQRQASRLKRRCHGQAMVETLVAAMFFLVPLFLAVAALGKFIDVQHSADMGARYAAWERTVWYESGGTFASINKPNQKSGSAINGELAARVLNDRSSATSIVKDNDKNVTTLVNGLDPMWRDMAGKAFLEQYNHLSVAQSSEVPAKDLPGAILSKLAAVKVGSLLSFVPPLPNNTLAVADVSFKKVGATSEVYQRLWPLAPAWAGLDFTATGAVLSNTWASNGAAGSHGMVEPMVPTAQGLGAAITAARVGIGTWDPAAVIGLEVGKISVDEVPEDRLK